MLGALWRAAPLEAPSSGISRRAGFATQAARAGVPERVIMWHTQRKDGVMLLEYIREGLFSMRTPANVSDLRVPRLISTSVRQEPTGVVERA